MADVIAIGAKLEELEHKNITAARIIATRNKTALYEGLLKEVRQARPSRMQEAESRLQHRIELRQESQEELLVVYKKYMQMLMMEKIQALESVGAVRRDRHRAAFALEEEDLQADLEVQVARLAGEVQQVVDGSKIRVEEAFRVASETQQTLLNIVQAEGASQTREIQAYVHTLFAESRLVFRGLFGDLQNLAFYGGVVILVVIAVVIVQELVAATRFIMNRLSSRQAPLRYQRALKGDSCAVESLPIPTTHKMSCNNLANTLREVSRSGRASTMPFALVHGPEGTGQRAVAEAIARDSGLCFAMAETRDIVGVGIGAGIYLSRLIEEHMRKRKPFVLLLHDADEILAARGSAPSSSSDQSAARGCLYALLQAMKLNNPYVAVLLTANVPLQSVDAAILDRMNFMLELPLPSKRRREAHFLHLLSTRLPRYLEESSVVDVDKYLERQLEASREEDAAAASPARRQASAVTRKDGGIPETHIPTSRSSKTVQVGSWTKSKNTKVALDKILTECRDSTHFDVTAVLAPLADISEGWSLKDIEVLVDRSMAAALGTETCKITSFLFLSELQILLGDKAVGRT